MLDLARVLGFLDFVGHWDPSLAFVLGGAVSISALGWQIARRLPHPALAHMFDLPKATRIDAPLIGGAVLFGIGWGLAGLCPGPAIAGLVLGHPSSFIVAAAMLTGMGVDRIVGFKTNNT